MTHLISCCNSYLFYLRYSTCIRIEAKASWFNFIKQLRISRLQWTRDQRCYWKICTPTNLFSLTIFTTGFKTTYQFSRRICYVTKDILKTLFTLQVAEYGPLPCSVVTTTRKFFTVLTSVILFGNVLIPRQWLGAILVFSGMAIDILNQFYPTAKFTRNVRIKDA